MAAMNFATDVSPIVLDIETTALDNAEEYLEPIPDAVLDESPIEAAKNLVDPAKIAADIEKRRLARTADNAAAIARVEQQRAVRRERFGLDRNVGRIVALGWWIDGVTHIELCPGEVDEARGLCNFWEDARHRNIVGYNVKSFDLPFLIQRSRYLQIPYPSLDLGKYAKRGIEDLYLLLTFNEGTYDQGAMRRTLKAFAKRFGIPVNDAIDGKDIPALVAAGDWGGVESHLRSDLTLTVALARRLGVVQ